MLACDISGQADDEWYADRLFIHVVFGPHAMCAGHFAVIGGIDDDGVLVEAQVVECVEYFADARIHLADVAVVSGECAAEFLRLFACTIPAVWRE